MIGLMAELCEPFFTSTITTKLTQFCRAVPFSPSVYSAPIVQLQWCGGMVIIR